MGLTSCSVTNCLGDVVAGICLVELVLERGARHSFTRRYLATAVGKLVVLQLCQHSAGAQICGGVTVKKAGFDLPFTFLQKPLFLLQLIRVRLKIKQKAMMDLLLQHVPWGLIAS